MDKYNKGYYIGYLLGCSGSPKIKMYYDGVGFKSKDYYKPDEYIDNPWDDMIIERIEEER